MRHPCCDRPLSRREMLSRCANGFGMVALMGMLDQAGLLAATNEPSAADRMKNPWLPRPGHHPAKVKSIIFLFMDGGPSQVDTFDPKPRLQREHGQPIGMKVPPTQFNNVGTVMQSPWKFAPRGESGLPISNLFPHVAKCADELCVIRSMVSNFSEHTQANYFMHSGAGQQGRPSMGSWITYGLGSESQELPGFVVLDSGMIPPGGRDLFHSSFLPAAYQGSFIRAKGQPLANLEPAGSGRFDKHPGKLKLWRALHQASQESAGSDPQLEAAISNYELAFRMQSAVPDLVDLSDETQATLDLYGVDQPDTDIYGRQCLVARRLVERGVRFIELLPPYVGVDRWDQHSNLQAGHEKNARATDQPVAALLRDLRARGLLDSTLVVWGGEFGRTPMAQGSNGRDHNPFGFSMWLAGGGVKGGMAYGATDDYGYYAIDNKVEIHDLHATMLHLLGVDHTRLTVRFGGRDMRLTDVHGHVLHDLLA